MKLCSYNKIVAMKPGMEYEIIGASVTKMLDHNNWKERIIERDLRQKEVKNLKKE